MRFMSILAKAKAALARNSVATASTSRKTLGLFAAFGVVALAMSPTLAMAAPWDGAAQYVLDIFTGGLARTIAIIAVIACGIMALVGKLSWDWAIKIVIGIVLIFGATSIIDAVISSTA